MRASAFPDSGLSRRRLVAIPVCSRHSRASRVSPPPPTRSRKGIRVSQQGRAWRPLRGSRLARLNHCPARAQPRPVGGWAQRHASVSVLGGSFWPCTAAESVYLVWEGSGLCGSWSARERVVSGAMRVSARWPLRLGTPRAPRCRGGWARTGKQGNREHPGREASAVFAKVFEQFGPVVARI